MRAKIPHAFMPIVTSVSNYKTKPDTSILQPKIFCLQKYLKSLDIRAKATQAYMFRVISGKTSVTFFRDLKGEI